MVNRSKSKSKELGIPTRIVFFLIGTIGAVILLVYSIRWEDLPFTVSVASYDITMWFMAVSLVFMSIGFYTLLKSSLLGEMRLD